MLRLRSGKRRWTSLPRRFLRAGGGPTRVRRSGIGVSPLTKWCVLLEVRSLIRNNVLTVAFLANLLFVPLLLYLLYYRTGSKDPAMVLWGSALLAAIPSVNYAGFCLGKDWYALPGYMTRMALREYVRGKMIFLRSYTVAFSLLVLPFVVYAPTRDLPAYCASVIYFVGFGGPLILYVVSFGNTKIDLRSSPLFGSQHVPLSATLFVMPVTMPMFFIHDAQPLAWLATFAIGAMGMVLSQQLSRFIEKNIARRKYTLIGLSESTL